MPRGVEDDPARDPGFERCSDEDCGGAMKWSRARRESVCGRCGKAESDFDGEEEGEDDGDGRND